MGKMFKNKIRGIFILLVMLCFTFVFAVACGEINLSVGGDTPGDGDDPPEPGQLASVVESSVTFNATSSSIIVTWKAVSHATSYQLQITTSANSKAVTTTVTSPTVDLRKVNGLSIPENGNVKITFTAKGSGYKDSKPITITRSLGGAQLNSPKIISFTNQVIAWEGASGAVYTVKVDGAVVVDNLSASSYDISGLNASARIDILAKLNGKTSDATTVMYDYDAGKLRMMPISNYILEKEVLRWTAVNGAIGYKVVDLDFNSYTVQKVNYDMAIRNIVYGVYPIMPEGSVVESAEIISPAEIMYLNGSGTVDDPYEIKTPFDLRAIDYYELKYAENGGSKNYYKIMNNIDYRTVSALESDSNMFTLRKPFFGTLDGNNYTLSQISVNNNNGYWALFEFIAQGGTVKNIRFSSAEIYNTVLDNTHPINAAIAMIANRNYGTVLGITLSGCKLTAKGGSIAGIVLHNHGMVSGCTVDNCTLKQETTTSLGAAAYEMAGIVLENYGVVSDNNVNRLIITGTKLGTTADFVAVNRTGGTVSNNSKG